MTNFKGFCYDYCMNVLPTVYTGALSYEEQINKLVCVIKEVLKWGVNVDDAIKELNDALNDLNLNIDKTITDKVFALLIQWKEDGTIYDLVKDGLPSFSMSTSPYFSNNVIDNNEIVKNMLEVNANDIYEMYDALGEYGLSKAVYTKPTISGESLFYYTYVGPFYNKVGNDMSYNVLKDPSWNSANKFFFTSGIHGDEKCNVYALYLSIKFILTSDTEIAKYIRNNYKIVVLPCVNPYGINNNVRENVNKVDINRNFDYNFTKGGSSGDAPFSEIETQFVRDILLEEKTKSFKSGTFILDCHDYYEDYEPWKDYTTNIGCNYTPMRVDIIKNQMLILDFITKNYPTAIRSGNPISQGGLGAITTFTNWAYHVEGFRLVSISEALNDIGGTIYSNESMTIAYNNLLNYICNVGGKWCGAKGMENIVNSNYLGVNHSDALNKWISAMPGGSFVNTTVTASQGLSNDMPTVYGDKVNGFLSIHRSPTAESNTAILDYRTYHTGRSCHAYFSSVDPEGNIKEWTEIQPRDGFSEDIFADSSNKRFSDIYNIMKTFDYGTYVQRVLTNDSIIEDLPINSGGFFEFNFQTRNNICAGEVWFYSLTDAWFSFVKVDGTINGWKKIPKAQIQDWSYDALTVTFNDIYEASKEYYSGSFSLRVQTNSAIINEMPEKTGGNLFYSFDTKGQYTSGIVLYETENRIYYGYVNSGGTINGWKNLPKVSMQEWSYNALTVTFNDIYEASKEYHGGSFSLRVQSNSAIKDEMPEKTLGNLFYSFDTKGKYTSGIVLFETANNMYRGYVNSDGTINGWKKIQSYAIDDVRSITNAGNIRLNTLINQLKESESLFFTFPVLTTDSIIADMPESNNGILELNLVTRNNTLYGVVNFTTASSKYFTTISNDYIGDWKKLTVEP